MCAETTSFVKMLALVESLELVVAKFAGQGRVPYDAKRLQLSLLAEASKTVRASLPKRVRKPKIVDGLTQDEVKILMTPCAYNGHGNLIGAIKAVRERTHMELREAKNLIEDYMEKHLGYRHFPQSY
jgi:hypothetical protein